MVAAEPGFTRAILVIVAGLTIWTLHLWAVYAWAAVACARQLGEWTIGGMRAVPLISGALTLVALAVTALLTHAALRRRRRAADDGDRFAATMALLVGAFSLLAIAWGGLPAVVVRSPCGP